jgi:hypothetical protein
MASTFEYTSAQQAAKQSSVEVIDTATKQTPTRPWLVPRKS